MEFINITKEFSIDAVICEQPVNIKIDQKHNCATFTTVNENKQKQYWNVYRHPVNDMMLVVLIGVGNNEDNMFTLGRYNESSVWVRCVYNFFEIGEYGNQKALNDILIAIEIATASIMKDLNKKF